MSAARAPMSGGQRGPQAVVMVFGVGVTLVLAVIMARVVQLQVAPGPRLEQLVSSRTSARPIPTLRGDLLDRRGRPLANAWFGYRLFLDPVTFDGPELDMRITRLAEALGVEAGVIGERIIPAIGENQQRAEARAVARAAGAPVDGLPGPIRHVRIVQQLNDLQAPNVRRLKMAGVHTERIEVREYPGADLAASIIGKVGFENVGLLGAERQLEAQLRGERGRVRYARDALGRPLWIRDGDVVPAQRGEDTRLSIDLEIQRMAIEELARGVADAGAAGGRLLVMDPLTGEILAMTDIIGDVPEVAEYPWVSRERPTRPEALSKRQRYRVIAPDPARAVEPAMARNRCIEDVYEPGSTFKPVVWAVVTEAVPGILHEKIETHDGVWRTEYWRTIRDVHKAERMTWSEALDWSSNIAMAQGAERLTPEELRSGIVRFGFGSRTGRGLPGEAAGIVTSGRDWTRWTHTSVAFGNEIAVTVVQLARAYCALAAPGELAGTMPEPRLIARRADESPAVIRARVMAPATALRARAALGPVVERLDTQMKWRWPDEPEPRYTMFGKSGTADVPIGAAPEGMRRPPGARGYLENQYISSFVAAAPAERPRLVVVVTIDDPGPDAIRKRQHYGSQCAGPVARRFMERALAYLGEPPSAPALPVDDRIAASH